MKIIAILLCFLFAVHASQENKIVLVTFSNKQLAIKSLKEFIQLHHPLFEHNSTTTPIEAGLFQSQQYYFVALKPFASRDAAKKILQKLQSDYPTAYISSYPNSTNHLILSRPVVANDDNNSTKPTETTVQEKAVPPLLLEQEFLEPLSIEEILNTTSSHNVTATTVETKPVKTVQNIQSVLYFSYGLLTLLIFSIVILVLKNHRLKEQLNYKQALLNAREIPEDTVTDKHIPIHVVDLARYIKTPLNQAVQEHASLLALKSIQQIQTCLNDIITIDSFMHGDVYIKNRTFPLHYITEDIAKRYQLTFDVSSDLPSTLVGSVETLEHIFLRLSYINIATIAIGSVSHSDESILLQFTLTYDGIENHAVDNAIVKQFVLSVGGTLSPNLDNYNTRSISMFTLPFLHAEKNSLKIKRP